MKGENLLNQSKNLKKVDMLPLSNDYVFKRIFGKGGNERILKSLLEAILKINIQKIEVKNPEIPKETKGSRFTRKMVVCNWGQSKNDRRM